MVNTRRNTTKAHGKHWEKYSENVGETLGNINKGRQLRDLNKVTKQSNTH